jgi:hypothetical protein
MHLFEISTPFVMDLKQHFCVGSGKFSSLGNKHKLSSATTQRKDFCKKDVLQFCHILRNSFLNLPYLDK